MVSGVTKLIYCNCSNCKFRGTDYIKCSTCMFIEPGKLFSKKIITFRHWEQIEYLSEELFEI
jgi:hypothetical protein